MHYILTSNVENDQEDAMLEGYSIYLERIECSFHEGFSLPAEDIDIPILFKIDEFTLRGVMTDHLNIHDIPGPVFSLNTKTLLEKKGIKNIEYYQLTLIDEFPEGKKTGKNETDKPKPIEYTSYFIANVVGLVDCVDHEKSILEYFYPPELRNPKNKAQESKDEINNPFVGENPNDIDFITKLVLDESKIDPSLKIFRLKDQPNLLIFHQSLVELIRKEGLSGFVFVPVEKYTDSISDDEKVEQTRLLEPTQLSEPEKKVVVKETQQKLDIIETKKGRAWFKID